MIDIFSIEPNIVTKDLRGKIIVFFGSYKSGKTYNASKFPKPLLLAFEKGYSAISGIKAQPINKWSEFKSVLRQLEKSEAKQVYESIIVDTVDIAYQLCEDFICQREGVDKIGDVPWGGGYKMVREEFFKTLRKIAMLDYGLVMISHSIDKQIKPENGEPYTKTVSTLGDRAKDIVFGMADIVGYARVVKNEEGVDTTYLFMRETVSFEAGSRWKHTPPYIEFTYKNLVDAIAEAIEKEEKESGITAQESTSSVYKEVTHYDFDKVMAEVAKICETIVTKNENKATEITEIVEEHLGKGKKVSNCTKEQVDIVALILDDLKDLLEKL